ncbi:hypothetical protein HYU09_00945 [Candidatus Woesearchaeota archaeon]|nr:hypothetical protein [Candidatus Woesearchaeota archaeon]
MKDNFIKQNYVLFINSFKKINLKFFLILAFDILFYFIFMQIGNFFIKIIEKKAANVDLTQNLLGLNQQAAAGLLGSVRGFFFFLIFSAILFLLLMVINWSIFKGLIWTITANKKFNFNFLKKFFLLNLVWLPFWFLLIFLFAVIINPATAPILMIITVITAFYFTNILYPLFLRDNKLRKIKEAFKLGIKKIHYFIVPYAVIGVLFYIISKAYSLIAANIGLNPNVFFGILLVFIAWARYYFVEIVGSLSK